jgi:hypothetical protein
MPNWTAPLRRACRDDQNEYISRLHWNSCGKYIKHERVRPTRCGPTASGPTRTGQRPGQPKHVHNTCTSRPGGVHTIASTCSTRGPGRAKPPSWLGASRGKRPLGPRVAPRWAAAASRPGRPGASALARTAAVGPR